MQITRTQKEFRCITNLDVYHEFENFPNTCLELYEHDPAHFLIAPGLVWQTALK